MAYDRYDRDDRGRWSDERNRERGQRSGGGQERGGRDERGFFERATEEISSWFGGSDDRHTERHGYGDDRYRGGRDEHRSAYDYGSRPREGDERHQQEQRPHREQDRGLFSDRGSSERDYNAEWRQEPRGGRRHPEDRTYGRDPGYQPLAGDYGRTGDEHRSRGPTDSGSERGRSYGRDEYDHSRDQRAQSPWDRDEYRRTSYAGASDEAGRSDRGRGGYERMGRLSERQASSDDPHYGDWRERHMSDLDREYQDYRRERQSHFEADFAGWREKRGQKRSMLGGVREHMEVVGNDDRHVGTIDKVAGDRLILTKSDPESGGSHHSISCHDIDRIEGDRVVLDCSADQARERWQCEDHSRALFERHEQGEDGPHILGRSFEGTYRR